MHKLGNYIDCKSIWWHIVLPYTERERKTNHLWHTGVFCFDDPSVQLMRGSNWHAGSLHRKTMRMKHHLYKQTAWNKPSLVTGCGSAERNKITRILTSLCILGTQKEPLCMPCFYRKYLCHTGTVLFELSGGYMTEKSMCKLQKMDLVTYAYKDGQK